MNKTEKIHDNIRTLKYSTIFCGIIIYINNNNRNNLGMFNNVLPQILIYTYISIINIYNIFTYFEI